MSGADSEFDQSMDEKMMRSSFYSTKSKFGGSAVTAILDTFSVSNILELTDHQRNLLEKLRQHMQEQVDEIRTQIDSLN